MIIVLTGAPGAGKGTQAELLEQRPGLRKVSTGDALRKHVKEGTDIGKVAAEIMNRGDLVPDDVLLKILGAEIGTDASETIILDGYPRNVAQAETLASLDSPHEVKAAIHLDVPTADLIARLSGRRVCGSCGATFHVLAQPPKQEGVCDKCAGQLIQRKDDSEESVKKRLEVYESSTKPVLDFYKSKGLYAQVDGRGEPEEIFKRLEEKIKSL